MITPYGEPVTVTLAADDTHGRCPTSFTWRGRRYWVSVLASWPLPRGWGCREPATRTRFRVLCANHQLFELSHDPISNAWVLDAVPEEG